MRDAIVLAGLLVTGPAWAGTANMAGWYLAMVNPDGTPTINSSPYANPHAVSTSPICEQPPLVFWANAST